MPSWKPNPRPDFVSVSQLDTHRETFTNQSASDDTDLKLWYPELQSEALDENLMEKNLDASLPWYSPNKDGDSNGDAEDTLSDSLEHRRAIPARLQVNFRSLQCG